MGRSLAWLVLRNRWFKNYFQNRSWDGLTRNVPSRPSLISNLFAWPLSTSFLYQGIFSKSFAIKWISSSHILSPILYGLYNMNRIIWLITVTIAGVNLNLIYCKVIILRVVLFATHPKSLIWIQDVLTWTKIIAWNVSNISSQSAFCQVPSFLLTQDLKGFRKSMELWLCSAPTRPRVRGSLSQ